MDDKDDFWDFTPKNSEELVDSLNESQRSAVEHVDGPLLILAGPGSGKTRVITHRIAYLINRSIPSYQILALTFTNKAASEMKSRIDALSPDHKTWTGTFHKFCARLLRQHAEMVGLQENFTIYDQSDSKKVIKQAIQNAEVDLRHYSADVLMNFVSNIKNQGATVDDYAPRPGVPIEAIAARVYPEYQKLLQMANGVDFDDLLLYSVDLLRQNPELRQSYDERYPYFMVDEYQDTNTAQYQLIRLLNHTTRNLAVTGDPDQSIYGWRGANIQNILEFEKDYPNVKVVRLEENYRSSKSILRVADQLITNNIRRKHKSLRTDNDEGKQVRLVAYPTAQDEAIDIVDSISLMIQKGERRPKDFAIFYRTNWLSRALEHAFRSAGVPYQIVNGREFYQRREIKDVLAYLHLLNNPSDNVAFERVINIPPRKIGKVTVSRLRRFAEDNRMPMLQAARRIDQIDSITKAPSKKIQAFVEMYDRIGEMPSPEVETVIKSVLEETAYRDWLTDDGSEEGFERARNVDELVVAAQEFDNEHPEDGGLHVYLEQAALVSDTDAWEHNADFVNLMTLHASKGLEFPCVYIVGLEDGTLPHERSNNNADEVEEERRLFFVGITRAKDELQISRLMTRFRKGSYWPVIASRFLMELPRESMAIFEPGSHEVDTDLLENMDPWLHEGIPGESNADEADFNTEFNPDTFEQLPSTDSNLTRDETAEPPKRKPTLPRIITAAQLAAEQAEAKVQTRTHPNVYQIGHRVEHAEYGVGTVTMLTGKAAKKTAEVDFPGLGKKRFRLAFSMLRILDENETD